MNWNTSLSDLQFHLAQLFPLKEDILSLAVRAGLQSSQLTVSDKGILFWYNVLIEARQQGRLDELLAEARRIFPDDEKLASFSAALIDQDHEIRLDALKSLCADIIREGPLHQALPLVEEIVERSPQGQHLEEDVIIRFAQTCRHEKDANAHTGKKRKPSLRFLESSKSDLISLIQAL